MPCELNLIRDFAMIFENKIFLSKTKQNYDHFPGHALGFWICGSSLFYKKELWASKSAGAHSTKSLSGCKRWCHKDLRVRAPAAPMLTHSLGYGLFLLIGLHWGFKIMKQSKKIILERHSSFRMVVIGNKHKKVEKKMSWFACVISTILLTTHNMRKLRCVKSH